eukprot:363926-Chlamydomonas_euryale.AAC.4
MKTTCITALAENKPLTTINWLPLQAEDFEAVSRIPFEAPFTDLRTAARCLSWALVSSIRGETEGGGLALPVMGLCEQHLVAAEMESEGFVGVAPPCLLALLRHVAPACHIFSW